MEPVGWIILGFLGLIWFFYDPPHDRDSARLERIKEAYNRDFHRALGALYSYTTLQREQGATVEKPSPGGIGRRITLDLSVWDVSTGGDAVFRVFKRKRPEWVKAELPVQDAARLRKWQKIRLKGTISRVYFHNEHWPTDGEDARYSGPLHFELTAATIDRKPVKSVVIEW